MSGYVGAAFAMGLGATDNGLCGTSACKKNMSLLWDLQIVDTSNVGETVTIKYYFSDTTSATGTWHASSGMGWIRGLASSRRYATRSVVGGTAWLAVCFKRRA